MSARSETLDKAFFKTLARSFLRERISVTISPDVRFLMERAYQSETSAAARQILKTQLDNVALARTMGKPVCQSPGFPTAYIRYGGCFDVSLLEAALREEVASATRDGFFRPSMVHPLTRKNSGDNSGLGVPNFELEYDDDLDFMEVIVSFKGCGAELGNAIKILTPAQLGENARGLKEFVVDTVIKAGGKPCPPYALGIGIGGQMDIAAKLSRYAVSVREWIDHNPDPALDRLEDDLLAMINDLGIGPGGAGGRTTALAVKIGLAYTHTAICPVAVNFYCWVARRSGLRIYPDGRVEYLFEENAR